jgi:hypothetical protein
MKSISTIKRQIKELRSHIDYVNAKKNPTKQEIAEARMAYLTETSLRWVVENVVGWGTRLRDTKDNAHILIKDLEVNP